MGDVGFFNHIADPIERKRRVDEAFAKHELDQLHETLDRTTPDDRVFMIGEMVEALADQLEAQRIREGRYGDRIPEALLRDPSPAVRAALRQVGKLP